MRIRAPGFRLGAANAVAFSSSGQLLGQVGHRVAVYSVPSRRLSVRSEWHYPHPAAITFGLRDDWFAVRSTTGAMAVAAVADGHPHDRLPPATDVADDSPLLAAPDDHLVEACSGGTLRVRRIRGLQVEYLEQHPEFMLGAIDASRDGLRWVLAVNARQLDASAQPACRIELRTWPFSTGDRAVLGDAFGFVHALAFASARDEVTVLHRGRAASAYAITRLSSRDGQLLQEAISTDWTGHQGFAWSPDGKYYVIGTRDGHLLLDSALTPLGHLAGDYPSDAAFSPDGQLLALGYWGHGLVIPTKDLRSSFSDPLRSPAR